LFYITAIIYQVHIMETIKRKVHFGDELKSSVHLVFGALHRVCFFVPVKYMGTGAKGIVAIIAERMPVGTGKPKMLLQCFTGYYPVLIVPAKRQRVTAFQAFVLYFRNSFEVFLFS